MSVDVCTVSGCDWDDRGTAASGSACRGAGDECRVLQLLERMRDEGPWPMSSFVRYTAEDF